MFFKTGNVRASNLTACQNAEGELGRRRGYLVSSFNEEVDSLFAGIRSIHRPRSVSTIQDAHSLATEAVFEWSYGYLSERIANRDEPDMRIIENAINNRIPAYEGLREELLEVLRDVAATIS